MKNRLVKYLLSGIFAFFIIIGITNAAEDRTIYIPTNGNPVQFIDGTAYKGVECNGDLQYFIVGMKPGGSWDVRLKNNISATSGTDTLVCTYQYHYGMTGDTQKLLDTNGSITFTFNFTSTVEPMTINATVSKYDPVLPLESYLPNFASVTSVELDANGQQYLENKCAAGTDMCTFEVKESTFNTLNGKDIEVYGTVVYRTIDGQDISNPLHITIRAFYNILASAGDYGVCNFDTSIWEVSPYSSNAYKAKYDDSTSGRISLPNCDASNSAAAAKFYGWVYIDPSSPIQESQNVMVSNVCKNYPKVEGNFTQLVQSGVDKFYTCYETSGTLYLNPAGGTIDVQPTWREENGKYLIVQESNFTLPALKSLPAYLPNDENNKVSYYWQASNEPGKQYKPGDVVTPNGQTFTAIYATESFIETSLFENSVMYVGDSNVYALTTIKFDTCSTNSPSNVGVNLDSETGGCRMNALTATADGQTIEVYGYNSERDQTYTLYLKILSRTGSTESGDSEFVIQFDEYAIAGYGQTGEITPTPVKPTNEADKIEGDTVANPICSQYNIKMLYGDANPYMSLIAIMTPHDSDGTTEFFATDPYDMSGVNNSILHHDSFRATCADTSIDPNSYATVCLDPAVQYPKTVKAQKASDIGLSNDVVNFLYYAIQNYSDELVKTYNTDYLGLGYANHSADLANRTRVAVTFVARLINADKGDLYLDTYASLKKYYYGFNYLADHINDPNVSWSPTGENPNEYKSLIMQLWNVYKSNNYPSTIHETKQSNVQAEVNDNVATFTGNLDLPSDIKLSETEGNGIQQFGNLKAKMVCASGLTCEIKELSKDAFKFDVTFDNAELLKDKENIKLYLYFKSYQDKSSLVFLSDGSGTTQRMVIFKSEQSYMFRYGGTVSSAVCELSDYPEDPAAFTPEQKEDFMKKKCCQLITNRYDKRYQEFCGDACNKVTYSIACETDLTYGTMNTQRDYDVYQVKEGFDKKTNTDQIGACVVDVTKATQNKDDNRKSTDTISDAVGNKLVLPDFKDNHYCRVSCKEDWNLKTPGFKNFVGEYGAVKAGQYFRLNEEIFLGGTRTCVTTYIDYKHYKDDVKILSGQLVAAYNTFVESKTAYDEAKKDWGSFKVYSGGALVEDKGANPYRSDENMYTTKLVKDGSRSYTCGCSYDKDNKPYNCSTCWEYHYTATREVCPIYNVHTPAGKSTYTNFNNNKNFSNAGTKTIHGESYQTSVTAGDDTGWYSGTPSVGYCEGATRNTFDQLIDEITYKSEYDNFATYKDYNRYDGNLPDDVWETPGGTLKYNMSYAKSEMARIKQELNQRVKDMGACQNFYMKNTAQGDASTGTNYFDGDTSTQNAYGKTGNGYDAGSQTVAISKNLREIPAPYEPDIRYQYEEYEYMTLVGDKNFLVPDPKENDKLIGGANNTCVNTDIVGVDGKTIQVCKNKINTYGYQSEGGWTNKDNNGKTYGGESNKNDGQSYVNGTAKTETLMICYPDGDTAKCESGDFYYYELNYIKQTLSNGGYYRNYGDFYTSQYSDVKIFAGSKEEALSQASVVGTTINDWGPLGGNSFPIGLDTRRNIYQYMYSFGNVGIYNDTNTIGNNDPTMGRIIGGYSSGNNASTIAGGESTMSSKAAVVADHTHACFYEVFEELCQCCGLPITSVVVMPSKVNTQDYLSGFGYHFSNSDKSSSSGTLGFYTSTVSLYDLDGSPNKEELSTNWSDDDSFRVYGNTYSTEKGGELSEAIVSVGEEIYNRVPEYSYTLDPAAMAEIRDYNELHGYEHNVRNMTNYGVCAIASDSAACNDTLSSNYTADETIIFAHYGSQFLEDLDKKYTTEGYKNLSTRKNICSITPGSLGSGTTYIDLMKSGSYGNCRWVDYVMPKDAVTFLKGDDTIVEHNDATYFRLAFK